MKSLFNQLNWYWSIWSYYFEMRNSLERFVRN